MQSAVLPLLKNGRFFSHGSVDSGHVQNRTRVLAAHPDSYSTLIAVNALKLLVNALKLTNQRHDMAGPWRAGQMIEFS